MMMMMMMMMMIGIRDQSLWFFGLYGVFPSPPPRHALRCVRFVCASWSIVFTFN